MKIFARFLLYNLFACILITGCQKEYSFEDNGNSIIVGGGTSEGTVGGALGPCTNMQLAGILAAGIPLTDSNGLVVEMNFTKSGTYSISTDTINGIHFSRTGIISATGATQVILYGRGTPLAPGNYSFSVIFKNSYCSALVTIYAVAVANGSDYFPTTKESFWHYKSSDPSALAGDTALTRADSASYTILNNDYRLFTSKSNSNTDSLFFRKGNGEYHEIGDLDVAGVASNFVAADYIFLKDNVTAGSTWESAESDATVNSVNVKMRLKFVVTEKNETVLLNNLVYKNVIKVRTTEQILTSGWTDVIFFDTWYAFGIGIINVTTPPPLYGYHLTRFSIQ